MDRRPAEFYAGQPTSASTTRTLTVDITGPASMLLGKRSRFQIRVNNPTDRDLVNVVVEARLPNSLQYVPGSSSVEAAGDRTSWRLGDVSARSARDITFEAVAQQAQSAPIQVTARVDVDASMMTYIATPRVRLDLTGPTDVVVGEPFEIVANITNTGDTPLTNGGLKLFRELSPGVEQTRPLDFSPYTLAPNASVAVRIPLVANQPGDKRIRGLAEADPDCEDAREHTFRVSQPKLQTTLVGPKSLDLEAVGAYSLVVENVGAVATLNTYAFLEFPAGWKLVDLDGGVATAGARFVYWSLGSLQPQTKRTVRCRLQPTTVGRAAFRGSASDKRKTQAESQLETVVEGHASMFFEMLPVPPSAAVGDSVRVDFKLKNRGPITANRLRITFYPPKGLRVDAGRSPGWGQGRDTSGKEAWVYDGIPTLAVGQSYETSLTVQAESAAKHTIGSYLDGPEMPGAAERLEPLRIYERSAEP